MTGGRRAYPRDHALDVFKGLLVVLMTWCHVLQFFGDGGLFPLNHCLETTANLLVFPGFVFAFGAAAAYAWYPKPWHLALPRMGRSAGRTLGAFWLSGLAFRVVREGKPFAWGTLRRILLLQDIPGWSEFLAAFSGLALVAMLLYQPVRAIGKRTWPLFLLGAASLLMCLIPYDRVSHPLLRLFIGTTAYASFPVVQYLCYFLLGVVYAQKERIWWLLPALAASMSAAGAARALFLGCLPSRFPPDYGWVLLPAGGVGLLLLLAKGMDALRLKKFSCLEPRHVLGGLGANSLYYLLAGNLVIFTLAGRGTPPQMRFGARGLFGWPIASPWGALLWSLALLIAAAFVAFLVQPKMKGAPPGSEADQ